MEATQQGLLAEADAALERQRERSSSLTTKTTTLVGFTFLAAPVLVRAEPVTDWLVAALVLMGMSAAAGLAPIVGRRLVSGVEPATLEALAFEADEFVFTTLLAGKIISHRANESRLRAIEIAWWTHVVAFAAAATAALAHLLRST